MDTSTWVLLMTIVMYNLSTKCRYYIRYAYTVGIFCACAVLFIPVMLLRPRHPHNARMPSTLARFLAKLVGVTYEVRGHENVDNRAGCVVMMNHQSLMDFMLMDHVSQLMPNIRFIMSAKVLMFAPISAMYWLCGYVFIRRRKPSQAIATMNKLAKYITQDQAQVGLYPEGTRNGGHDLLPFKKGGFHLAIESQSPILPVVCSKYYFIDSTTYRFDYKGHLLIQILPPVPTKGLTKDQLPQLMDQVWNQMNEAYHQTSEENKQISKNHKSFFETISETVCPWLNFKH